MSFNLRQFLGAVAPTIATAYGGPLAGMAVKALGSALGVDQPTEDTVSTALASATPDILAKVKAADQEFAEQMKKLDIDLAQIDAGDRASARQMQMSTRSLTVPVLSWVVVGLVILCEGMLMFGGHKPQIDDIVLGRIMGTLDAALLIVLNFHFGSSAQSHMQTRIIGEKK